MENNNNRNRSLFFVVHFFELPFKGVDNYVCVPFTWVILRRTTNQKIVVAYPNNENPTETRERAKQMNRYNDEWRYYSAVIKYETKSYEDAERWIATRNNYGPSVTENSRINGTQSTSLADRELRSSNRNDSSKSKEDKSELTVKPCEIPRKPSPNIISKRPASKETKQYIEPKRSKMMSIAAAKAKCGLIPNANAQPGSSRAERSTSINDQLMESAQTKETTAVNNGEKSNVRGTKSIDQKVFKRSRQEPSMPIINEYGPTGVINIDGQAQSQRDKQPSETNSNIQNHLTSNMTSAPMTALMPPARVEQNPQPYQHNNQTLSQDSRNSSSTLQPRITDVRSMASTSNNQESRADDVSNNGPSTSQDIPDSISARLQNVIREKPSLIQNKMRLENIMRNVALQNRSTLMDEIESLSGPPARELPVTRIQNWSPVDSQESQHEPRINIERPHNVTAVDPRVVLQSINNVASASQNSSSTLQRRPSFIYRLNGQQNLTSPQHMQQAMREQDLPRRPSGGLELPYRAQLKSIEQESRRPPRDPRPAGVFPIPTVERPSPLIRGIQRRKPSPVLSENPRSISEALLTTRNNYLSNEQRLQVLLNESSKQLGIAGLENVIQSIRAAKSRDMLSSEMLSSSSYQLPRMEPSVYENMAQNPRMQNQLVNQPNARNLTTSQFNSQDDIGRSTAAAESSSRGVDGEYHTDVYMEEEPVSPAYGTDSDSGCDTNQEVAFGHEIIPIYEVDQSEYESLDRSTAAQNASSRGALEQQMLDQFATIFTQMGSTMYYTANMFNHIRDSIMETAKTYQMLFGNIEKFNAMDSSASHASSFRNVRQEVPSVAEERPAARVERGNRDNGNQPSNNAVNEPLERNHNNRWRFVLPPEYDPEDTKWTLKYREHTDGLVELLPRSGIYVSYAALRCSKEVSNNCRSLAQQLLVEVFNRSALSVCSSMTEKAQIGYKMRPDARPDLDDHGCLVLLNFVLDYGLKRGWNTDMLSILQGLNDKVKDLRYKFGVVFKC